MGAMSSKLNHASINHSFVFCLIANKLAPVWNILTINKSGEEHLHPITLETQQYHLKRAVMNMYEETGQDRAQVALDADIRGASGV